MNTNETEQHLKKMEIFALPNMPRINPGDDIGRIIYDSALRAHFTFQDADVIVVAQKIVSKAEGRIVSLENIIPSERAIDLSRISKKDPRICQIILDESKQIIYANERAIITEHVTGLISGLLGIDTTNTGSGAEELAILLPQDSDESAKIIRRKIFETSGKTVGVIISDSIGRPFRKGSVGMAIGFAGISALQNVNSRDLWGKKVQQQVALVDELAGAASPLMGESNEGYPVVVIRGVNYTNDESGGLKNLIRPIEEDQIWP